MRNQEISGIDIEIIVLDNGSNDATPDIPRDFEATVFVRPNLSISSLRNLGEKELAGRCLAWERLRSMYQLKQLYRQDFPTDELVPLWAYCSCVRTNFQLNPGGPRMG